MTIRSRTESLLLFIGDVALFFVALWLTLLVRYAELPSAHAWTIHLAPFTLLFAAWVAVFYIAGLYGKHTLVLKSRLPTTILNAQLVNMALAVGFFYFIPLFTITPKINLFIYLGISFVTILLWRIYGHRAFGFRKREKAILIGSGEEMRELRDEVNHNRSYSLTFVSSVDLDAVEALDFQGEIIERLYSESICIVVIHFRSEKVEPVLPRLYNLIFSHIRFIDMHRVYEDIFDRVPLSLLQYSWFLENISFAPNRLYDSLKRAMDLTLSFLAGLATLPLYPLIYGAIKLDDGGPPFIVQERLGRGNRRLKIRKFRTMSVDSGGPFSALEGNYDRITRVGGFLRRARLDELPQLWSVLVGDLSLIGPRPELPELAALYEKEIPYYNVRHLITPGLSGWAQIHQEKPPKFRVAYDDTKLKLAYDLYYIKNRSFMLDVKIAIKTLRILVSRSGL